MDNKELIKQAKKAMQNAHSPYSKFNVGAALLSKQGNLYCGCNIENASYGATICAERVAIVKALSEGDKTFEKIAIVGSHNDFTYPCGICRQFLSEFGLDIKLVFENGKEIKECTLRELLPHSFSSF